MKLKLDENLPRDLTRALSSFGHDVHTVRDEGLQGRPDAEIWKAAQADARFFITQDMDFSDSRRFAPGTRHGLLVLRLSDPSFANVIARVEEIFLGEAVNEWQRCLIVATEQKIRVLRPQEKKNG